MPYDCSGVAETGVTSSSKPGRNTELPHAGVLVSVAGTAKSCKLAAWRDARHGSSAHDERERGGKQNPISRRNGPLRTAIPLIQAPTPDNASDSNRVCNPAQDLRFHRKSGADGGRYRIRTYDFHRVKMALYR
jgi:hypothetical protein